ncbi:MAG TPA: hypothetical protein VF980_05040 [Thermoanaerobaculia bacterium]
MDVNEVREVERFLAAEPLAGSYGSASVSIVDISARGVQIEHAQPIRLGTRARLWFKRGDVSVSTQALTIWSHLSKTPNTQGKYLYKTGLRVEVESREYEHALQKLLDHGILMRDPESLEKKRKRAAEKIARKSSQPTIKFLFPEVEVPPDQQLLIEHARKQLLAHPEEAQRWYQRAKYAITHGAATVAVDAIRNREDVLAVWEYLERSVEISTIAAVFERMRINQSS